MEPVRKSSEAPIELIVKARAGDDEALEELIRAYQRRIAGMVFSLIGDDNELQDVCQRIFVKMAMQLNRLNDPERFESWLFTMARNAAFDHLRKRRRRSIFVPWHKAHDSIAETKDTSQEQSAVLNAAIALLPPDQRDLLTMLRTGEWSYAQLALTTGHTLAALKTRLSRTRRRLRQLIAEAESK